jgi:hypothetical protein
MHKPGLKHIGSERLRALLAVVHAGKLGLPVSMPGLMLAGFGDIADQMPVLAGLDERGVRAALVIALAERSA